ncbi:unnamed protein product, partial [Callosobruchus maculatus]
MVKFGHLNVRSLLSDFSKFVDLISEDFDLFAITETWLSSSIPTSSISLTNYNFFRNDRDGRGGGVGVYVKSCLPVTILDISTDNLAMESLWIKIIIHKTVFCVGIVYRPPSNNCNDFVLAMDNILPQCLTNFENVMVLGDFNINLQQPDNVLSSCFKCYGFTQLVMEPTRITSSTSTLLDGVFTNAVHFCTDVLVLDSNAISDHQLVCCHLHLPNKVNAQKFVTFRDYKNFDEVAFSRDLANIDWFKIIEIENIDNKVKFFTENIVNTFCHHAPVRTVRVSKPRAPWLTYPLRIILKERDDALRKFKADKTPANWNAYKEKRNFALASIRREKTAYLSFLEQRRMSKELWHELKNLSVSSTKNQSTKLPEDLRDPTHANNYFCSVFDRSEANPLVLDYYEKNLFNMNKFSFVPVDPSVIQSVVMSLKSNAAGIDTISLSMLKLCLPIIIPYLTHIVNVCLETGYFPSSWKVALINPVPKVKNPKEYSDLRPISLLCVLSKVLEKVAYLQIIEFVNTNGILPASQSGFRKSHSTTTSLLNL